METNPEYSLEGLMLKLKLQYCDHPMQRDDSLEKTLMLGKIEGGRRGGWQRMRWLDGITHSQTWVWASFGSWWQTGKPGMLQSMGSQRVGHNWVTNTTRLVIAFLPRSSSFNFMAVVTICSDFGVQENKVCHCFHCFPIYLSWSDGTRCHDLSFFNVEF